MALSEIRKLGDPILLMKSLPVERDEVAGLMPAVEKMWNLIIEFRKIYNRGRAIAAPQTGLLKRIICINAGEKEVLFNPEIESASEEMIDIWDDCMSFPNLLVLLKRHKRINISYYDADWKRHFRTLEGDMSELIQHEYDHLNGMLALQRVSDINSLKWIDDLSENRQDITAAVDGPVG